MKWSAQRRSWILVDVFVKPDFWMYLFVCHQWSASRIWQVSACFLFSIDDLIRAKLQTQILMHFTCILHSIESAVDSECKIYGYFLFLTISTQRPRIYLQCIGGARGDFMKFSGKFGKIVCWRLPWGVGTPPPPPRGGILDPPLQCSITIKMDFSFEQRWSYCKPFWGNSIVLIDPVVSQHWWLLTGPVGGWLGTAKFVRKLKLIELTDIDPWHLKKCESH